MIRSRLQRPLAIMVALCAMTTAFSSPARALAYAGPIMNYKSDRCIGIAGSGNAGQWTCTAAADQSWDWGGGVLYRQLVNGQGKCLGVKNSDRTQGAQIVARYCTGTLDEFWKPVNDPATLTYVLYNKTPIWYSPSRAAARATACC
ncbi:hypothetical protein ABT158_49745 [Nonomuraea sp. NPDC001636]|uniref:RICIN domain-containing protein n=1 Tax=Nonomuraea sp. NPDC001636 TaxID=3154391 RepID=UPI0033231640